MPTAKESALASLRFARGMTDSLLKNFPEDKRAFQPAPTDNHVLWVVGHQAMTYAWLKTLLDGKKLDVPDTYDALFGGKSKPKGDAKMYPAYADLKKQYDRYYADFVAAVEKMSDAEAAGPCASDTGGFAKTKLDAVERAAWHEGWHAGQISSIRRALGLPPVMG